MVDTAMTSDPFMSGLRMKNKKYISCLRIQKTKTKTETNTKTKAETKTESKSETKTKTKTKTKAKAKTRSKCKSKSKNKTLQYNISKYLMFRVFPWSHL